MTDRELMQLALDALDSDSPDIQLRAATTLRARLAQQEEKPKPVGWISKNNVVYPLEAKDEVHPVNELRPLYTAPPPRPWQGLTDEERKEIFESMPGGMEGFLRTWGWLPFSKALEQKLKEKNT